MPELLTMQDLANGHLDVKALGEAANGDENTIVTTRTGNTYPSVKKAIKTLFENGGLPAVPFATKELMTASDLIDGDYAVVTDDTDNNGLYVKKDGIYILTEYGRELEFKSFKTDFESKDIGNIIPILVDSDGKVLVGYNATKETPILAGLEVDTYPDVGRHIPVLVDSLDNILIGYDTIEQKPILAGFEYGKGGSTGQRYTPPEYLYQLSNTIDGTLNYLLFYGQSLSVGQNGTPVKSLMQNYSNLTFNSYPRMTSSPTSLIPLVESGVETPCSSAANYASVLMARELGINYAQHPIMSSTAGIGAASIDALNKGSSGYTKLLSHVSRAKTLHDGNLIVRVVAWVQGEANTGTYKMEPEEYYTKLIQLQIDASQDIKAITGQSDDVEIITYQTALGALSWEGIPLKQLEAVEVNDKFHFSTPIYHIPHSGDNIHLNGVGYKLLGAYFGRSYKQRVIDGVKPDFLNPTHCILKGNKALVFFKVPKLPLVLDTENLAITTNHGFRVLDESGLDVEITSINVVDNTVELTLGSSPNSVEVRYALDYLGTGLSILGGASGNLRDSTDDTVSISGIDYTLYHVAPHFKLTSITDKGI